MFDQAIRLPQKWTDDRQRCAAAGVPKEVPFATKPEIAVALLEEALQDGVDPGPVFTSILLSKKSKTPRKPASVLPLPVGEVRRIDSRCKIDGTQRNCASVKAE